MQIHCDNLPWPLDKQLIQILNAELVSAKPDDGITINFRDPNYSPETGGFHPVEVALNREGKILYITDFSYEGHPSMAELCKALDFDFSLGLFQYYGMENPITAGREIFKLFQSNFISYFNANVYKVSVEPW